MTSLSKHPKWRSLSSKDRDELKKFVKYLALLRKNGFYETHSSLVASRITQESYKEIYGHCVKVTRS